MNTPVFILLIFAVIYFSDKDPTEYALKAVEWIDRQFFGFKDLHDNLSRAYSQQVSPAMAALKTDTRHRMQRAAKMSFRLNKCMYKMEQSISAQMNIGVRRTNVELADLSKDFMRDSRTTRMLAQLKVLNLIEAVNEGAVWDHLTLFSQRWVAVQEMVWVHSMGVELLNEAVKVRAEMSWDIAKDIAKEQQHEREYPQRLQKFVTEMVVMVVAVNFLGLF